MTSWQRPTDAQIEQVTLLALRPQEERYFFAHLENPLWIDALFERGEVEPPPPIVGANGGVSYKAWPFSTYLARVANDHPDHVRVAGIVEGLAETENVFVRDDLTRAITALDPCSITKLLPTVAAWVAEHPSVLRTMKLTGELAVHALSCDENRSAVRALLTAQFVPHAVHTAGSYRAPAIDRWEARVFASRFIPLLVDLDWALTVSTLLDGLAELIDAQLRDALSPAESRYDFTGQWLRESSEEDDFYESGEPLAYLAARSLETISRSPTESVEAVLSLLDRDDWAVYRRLRLHYLSCRAETGNLVPPILAALADPIHAKHYRPCPEYDSLLKATYENASKEAKGEILAALESAAPGDGDQSDYWLYGRLDLISDDLPVEWRTVFRDFTERFGPPPSKEARGLRTPESPEKRSPLEPKQAESMTPFQLASYAREWSQSKEDYWFEEPTWKGLAADVEREAKGRPIEFSQASSSFVGVERTVVNALFSGLKGAVQDGHSIDWNAPLHLIRSIATEDESIEPDREHRFGRDVSWSEAKREALELIQAGLRAENPALPNSKKLIWDAVESMAIHGDVSFQGPIDEARDSVFAALNSTRSCAVYAAVTYLLWQRRNGSTELQESIHAFFERILDPGREPFIGMRAAVAHNLPQLAHVNESWLIRLLPSVFPDPVRYPEHWSAAWDAYLRHSSPLLSRAVLTKMSPYYEAAVDRVEEDHQIEGQNDRVVLLGIHLATMFLCQDIELDDANLDRFFQRAPATIRSRVFGWIGRVAGQEDLPDAWYERVRQFVEWREQCIQEEGLDPTELQMLGWLVASGKFPVAWWAPRLGDAIGMGTDSAEVYIPLEEMMGQVASASGTHPEMALDVLEQVVNLGRYGWELSNLESASQIVTVGMNDASLAHQARSIADKLARAGFDDFERFSLVSQ